MVTFRVLGKHSFPRTVAFHVREVVQFLATQCAPLDLSVTGFHLIGGIMSVPESDHTKIYENIGFHFKRKLFSNLRFTSTVYVINNITSMVNK